MTTPITPSTTAEYATQFVAPADGETANAASLIQFVQPFADAIEYARRMLRESLSQRAAKCSASPNLTIDPLGTFLATSSGDWKVLEHTVASTFDVTTKGAVLANNTRYWVYAFDNAGSVDFVVETATGPDALLHFKSGDTDLVFVTTFITDGAATMVPYTQSGRSFRYGAWPSSGSGAGYGNLILDGGTVSGSTSFTLPVPSQAKNMILRVGWASNGAKQVALQTTTGGAVFWFKATVNSGALQYDWIDYPTTDGRQFDYSTTDAATLLYVWAAGFDL